MRFQVERQNGTIETVEADSFSAREITSGGGVLSISTTTAIHYLFHNNPTTQYGQYQNVAVFTDVKAIRSTSVLEAETGTAPECEMGNQGYVA